MGEVIEGFRDRWSEIMKVSTLTTLSGISADSVAFRGEARRKRCLDGSRSGRQTTQAFQANIKADGDHEGPQLGIEVVLRTFRTAGKDGPGDGTFGEWAIAPKRNIPD